MFPRRTVSRRFHFSDEEVKPLLTNLSPSATLDALMSTEAIVDSTDRRRNFLRASVEGASEGERAWGIRAAVASQKIRDWVAELTAWPWIQRQKHNGGNFEEEWAIDNIEEYTQRIEIIRDNMETLQVEDIKAHVRQAHIKAESSVTQYARLEDFTAIITATLVQALPPLLHLDSLLKAWSIRLVVLRKKAPFLQDLQTSQEAMASAWRVIGRMDDGIMVPKKHVTRQTFLEVKAVLQDHISRIGHRADSMLDQLEGTQDVLPDSWLDTVDGLEGDYSLWVAKTEELVLNNELELSANTTVVGSEEQGTLDRVESADQKAVEDEVSPRDLPQHDGSASSKLSAPFDPDIPLKDFSLEASASSKSSIRTSTSSCPGSSMSGMSTDSIEIGRASIATNPGSPMKVVAHTHQSFQNAQIKRFGSVKNKDIRRLLVRRSDSCPTSMSSAYPVRRASVGGTSLASIQPDDLEVDHTDPETQATEGARAAVGAPGNLEEPQVSEDHQLDHLQLEPPEDTVDVYRPTGTPASELPESRLDNYEDLAAGSAQIRVPKQRAPKAPLSEHSPSKHKNSLDERISLILNRIPADIRLKTAEAARPHSSMSFRPKTPVRRSLTPKFIRSRAPTPTPGLTLAPASDQGPKIFNRSVHEPEIKLYHLQQNNNASNGKEATPVKLYVRLVGAEGERVMVRVGGGWADLGEYLKEYAAHHGATNGKRNISDFQIQNLPTPGSGPHTNPNSRPGTRPGSSQSSYGFGEPPSPTPFAPKGLGLAGPTAKETTVEPEHQKMVDEVVKQMNGGAGGKMGGIKRVFLKRRPTLGEKL